jgi:hypothetical protein
MAQDNVVIIYRVTTYGPNREYAWPKPATWKFLSKAAREEWSRGQLKKLNAQAIFITVSYQEE